MSLVKVIFFHFVGVVITLAPGLAFSQEGGKGGSPTQGLGMFLPLILIFVIFYLLIVRPQQKQAKKRQEMINALQKGDEVVTVGGVHGKVVGVADQILTVEIADNCKVKMERSGVQSLKGEPLTPAKK